MSDGMNRVILIGNLGGDPELRYVPSGQAKLSVRIATTETYRDRDNEKKERTDWHHVVIWGKRAEALNKLIARGDRIGVEGRIQTRSYDDTEGKKRYWTEIVATNILLLGGRRSQMEFPVDKLNPVETGHEVDVLQGDGIPF
jgi:single-strand DNA-binding protein